MTTILAPASGRIMEIIERKSGGIRIVIFLGVLDYHTQVAPIDGCIAGQKYCRGRFFVADSPKATKNEKLFTVFKTNVGIVTVVQIAGVVARRIRAFFKVGDCVKVGDKFGKILFGSRVDLLLPKEFKVSDVVVRCGEKVEAGETVLVTKFKI